MTFLLASLDLSEGRIAGYTAAFGGIGAAGVFIWSQVDKARQKSRMEWDQVNKDSLSANLQKVLTELQEAQADRKAIRERLHLIRDEANAARIEAANLREQANETTARLIEATQEISRLTHEITSLRRQSAGQPEKTASAVMAAISQSQHEMPVVPPASTPPPEARP